MGRGYATHRLFLLCVGLRDEEMLTTSQVLREIEEEDRLWQSKAKKKAKETSAAAAESRVKQFGDDSSDHIVDISNVSAEASTASIRKSRPIGFY